jgi:hypothetical protein
MIEKQFFLAHEKSQAIVFSPAQPPREGGDYGSDYASDH